MAIIALACIIYMFAIHSAQSAGKGSSLSARFCPYPKGSMRKIGLRKGKKQMWLQECAAGTTKL